MPEPTIASRFPYKPTCLGHATADRVAAGVTSLTNGLT
jgi:hypothetical protein